MQGSRRFAWIAALVLHLVFVAVPRAGAEIGPPENGYFVQDLAGLIDAEDVLQIQAHGNRLLAEHAIPLVVLTIDSMAEYGGRRISVESFARRQFEAWGIDPYFPYTEYWRRGILLLVAKDDRKARIELGAEWAQEFDPQCERIMYEILVPAFKGGLYSQGIADGTEALARMSRGEDVGVSMWRSIEYKIRAALVDWEYKIGTFGVIGLTLLLSSWLNGGRHSSRRYSGSSGFRGGGFGGGGGASGSW